MGITQMGVLTDRNINDSESEPNPKRPCDHNLSMCTVAKKKLVLLNERDTEFFVTPGSFCYEDMIYDLWTVAIIPTWPCKRKLLFTFPSERILLLLEKRNIVGNDQGVVTYECNFSIKLAVEFLLFCAVCQLCTNFEWCSTPHEQKKCVLRNWYKSAAVRATTRAKHMYAKQLNFSDRLADLRGNVQLCWWWER